MTPTQFKIKPAPIAPEPLPVQLTAACGVIGAMMARIQHLERQLQIAESGQPFYGWDVTSTRAAAWIAAMEHLETECSADYTVRAARRLARSFMKEMTFALFDPSIDCHEELEYLRAVLAAAREQQAQTIKNHSCSW